MPYEDESKHAFDMLDMYISGEKSDLDPEYIKTKRNDRDFHRVKKKYSTDQTIETTCKRYEEEWIRASKFVNGSNKVSQSHSCFEEECPTKGFITNLGNSIYRCEASGKVHHCSAKGIGCKEVVTTTEGIYVCLISGRVLGECLVNEDFHKEGDENAIVEIGGDETELPQMRERRATSRARNPNKIRVKSMKIETDTDVSATSHARSLFSSLVLNWNARCVINEEKYNRAWLSFNSRYKAYAKDCIRPKDKTARVMSFWEVHSMYRDSVSKAEYLCKVEDSPENKVWATYYQGLVGVLWNVIKGSPHYKRVNKKTNMKKFALGALYLFRESYVCGRKDVNWISHVLPKESDISNFKFNIGDVTKSINFIKAALTSESEDKGFAPLESFEKYHNKFDSEDIKRCPVPFSGMFK